MTPENTSLKQVELNIGDQISAKRYNAGSGGVNGPKFKATSNSNELFIVGHPTYSEVGTLSEENRGRIAYSPKHIINRIIDTVIYEEIFTQQPNFSAHFLPKVSFETLRPVAIVNPQIAASNWEEEPMQLVVNQSLGKSFWQEGRNSAERVRQLLTRDKLDLSDPGLNSGLVYPFIENVTDQEMVLFNQHAQIEEQLALNIAILKLNKLLYDHGMIWGDQGKGGATDNYLVKKGPSGDLNLVISDYDINIVDEQKYRQSKFNWPMALDYKGESIASNLNLNKISKLLCFENTDLGNTFKTIILDLDSPQGLDVGIQVMESLAKQLQGLSEEQKKVFIDAFIKENRPDETEETILETKNEPIISSEAWAGKILLMINDDGFQELPRGIESRDQRVLVNAISHGRSGEILQHMMKGELPPLPALVQFSYEATKHIENTAYLYEQPEKVFRMILFHVLPDQIKTPEKLQLIKESTDKLFTEVALEGDFSNLTIDSDPDVNDWYLDSINEAIKNLFTPA